MDKGDIDINNEQAVKEVDVYDIERVNQSSPQPSYPSVKKVNKSINDVNTCISSIIYIFTNNLFNNII